MDWYEWGQEALEEARRTDRPIFLSIGYSACHWCHVMAHESFEDEAVAAVMNRHFVNIKVDREERPDLDEIYMQATLFMHGQGGWPMSVWLTPELKPFLAGTYFPPESKWGRPGFKEVCQRVAEAWAENRDAVCHSAERLARAVAAALAVSGESAGLSLTTIDHRVDALAEQFDRQRGGVISGGGNKFPPSMALDLFLRAAIRRGAQDTAARDLPALVELTLDRMAHGGIYDQLGGGLARYSTDPDWHVPHFEKMLYDQALVSRSYCDAYQFFRQPLYGRIAGEIFDYVIADLQSPAGGFFSSRDADSEGVEGRYYVWTADEILQVLGPDDGRLVCSYFDVSTAGNWQDPHAPGVAKNVLHVPRDLATVARLHRLAPEELERRLAAARPKLLAARARRVPPARDEKILAEWNGLMIGSLARGGAVLNEPKYVAAAARAADFLLAHQYRDGRLVRAYRDGRTLATAFLTDYAALIEGLLELYEATFERRRLDQAANLLHTAIDLFHDDAGGGFFFTAHDHEPLIARAQDVRDGATPSGNSLMLMNLLRLSVMLGDQRLRAMADRLVDRFAADVLRLPGASERFLAGVEFALLGPVELAVVGEPSDARTQALLRQIHATYLPNRVLMLADPAQPSANPAVPLLENRSPVNGGPAVHICRNYACRRPLTTPTELARELEASRAAV